MEKRLIVAISLSVLVIVFFQMLLPPKGVKPPVPAPVAEKARPFAAKKSLPPVVVPEHPDEIEIVRQTERYVLTFTNIGGSVKDIKLKDYSDPRTDQLICLFGNLSPEKAIFSVKSDTLINDLFDREFELVKNEQNKIAYAYTYPGKFRVTKEYTLHNSYDYIELRISIDNLSESIIYRDYELIGAAGLKSTGVSMGRSFLEADLMIDGKLVRKSRMREQELFTKGIVSWAGLKARYFAVILKPQQEAEGSLLKKLEKSNFISGIKTKMAPISPNASSDDYYALYVGPNDKDRLGALGLQGIVTYGFFSGLSAFLLSILKFFHGLVRNWGVAIILLTLLINVVLLPLTKKSFQSIRKIQEVQPHIEKLRKLHKDSPQKLNKELAELYRQYNINPFGGCLPLLLQMPIFIALYQGLMRSIELKGANFLWIKDLSYPDAVPIPFALPLIGSSINILPLLTALAMFAQQKVSTKNAPVTSPEQASQQKFMSIFFPLFFGVLFYNFPAGLVLYWLTNTTLMMIEQYAMRRGHA